MRTVDFDYDLPDSLIAQEPAVPRDSCKLMVVHDGGALEHRVFRDIAEYLHPGDLLVVNETRVLPARMFGSKKGTGGAVEVLLLDRTETDGGEAPGSASVQTWNCLVKPGKRLKVGAEIVFDDDGESVLEGTVIGIDPANGSRSIRFSAACGMTVDEAIHRIGHTPLPPYIKGYTGDEELYQTVYSQDERSAAAPTAGLHFTEELLDRLREEGIELAVVHLEVGLDTFRLVAEDDPLDHEMHTELYSVPQETVDAIMRTKERGGRVVAVGTTSVRSLESAAALLEGAQDAPDDALLVACEREATSLYILPGYEFKVVDAIITNFHVPRSTLMMLVSAFSGRESIMNAYETAKRDGYRFFSFGDAMLLL